MPRSYCARLLPTPTSSRPWKAHMVEGMPSMGVLCTSSRRQREELLLLLLLLPLAALLLLLLLLLPLPH